MGNAAILFCLGLAIASNGNSATLREEVDMIEINHFHDDLGRHVYDQVIFYGWNRAAGDYHVRAWCLLDDPSRWPRKNASSGRYHVYWFDRDQRVHREVFARHLSETWTQIDPERANKRLLDEKYRTALLRPTNRNSLSKVTNVAQTGSQAPANIR